MQPFKIKLWGPEILRDILKEIEKAINARTPIADKRTIFGQEMPDGVSLSADSSASGGSAQTRPFQLVEHQDDFGLRIKVEPSTIDGVLMDGFSADPSVPYLISPSAGTHYVYFHAVLTSPDDAPPEVESIVITTGGSLPTSTTTNKYIALGSYSYTAATETEGAKLLVSNYAYGPGSTSICRDWFTNPATYSFTLNLEG